MIFDTPEALYEQWNTALNAGQRDALLDCYEPEATFVAQPGETVKGREAIKQVLDSFLALKGQVQLEQKLKIQGEGIVLMSYAWSLEGRDPATGEPVNLGGQTVDVVRQQSNGGWLVAIDNPYGL